MSADKAALQQYLRTAMSSVRKAATTKGPIESICTINNSQIFYSCKTKYSHYEIYMRNFIIRTGYFQEFVDELSRELIFRYTCVIEDLYPGLRVIGSEMEAHHEIYTSIYWFNLNMNLEELIDQGKIHLTLGPRPYTGT